MIRGFSPRFAVAGRQSLEVVQQDGEESRIGQTRVQAQLCHLAVWP